MMPTEGMQADVSLDGVVRAGSTVAMGHLSAEPYVLRHALERQARDVGDVTLLSGMLLTDYGFLDSPSSDSGLSYVTWFMPGALAKVQVPTDRVGYLPTSWSQTVDWLLQQDLDVALLQVAPADDAGRHSYGTSASYVGAIVDAAQSVIAEVNAHMPRTHGASVATSRIDLAVPVDRPLPEWRIRGATSAERQVATHAASLVPDGATLQVGVGTVPNEVLAALAQRGAVDLRLHSTLPEGYIGLLEAGCLATDEPHALVGEVLGSHELYAAADRNPQVRVVGADETHTPEALARLNRFVSVNSALEVDLYGQINVEFVGGRQMGGVGGSVDFLIAAQGPGNLSIVALASRTRSGRARIVPRLDAPVVSIPRYLSQCVVTEWGVADLRGCTEDERARRLVAIAHPDDRPRLRSAWDGRVA